MSCRLRYPGCQLVESRLAPLLSDSVDAVEFSIVLNREEHLRAIGRVRKDGHTTFSPSENSDEHQVSK